MDQQQDHGEQETHPAEPEDEARRDQQPVETDPRFPSGKWEGYMLIPPSRGPQSMVLDLTFRDGIITGSGRDTAGQFTIAGTYGLDGRLSFVQRYSSGRWFHFAGCHVSQGPYLGFSGDWALSERFHGRFWIERVREQKR